MKTKYELDNDVFIMEQALCILSNHFQNVCDDDDATSYGLARIAYLKNAIVRYQETFGESGSPLLSLQNLFSSLYNERGENTYDVIWTDIRDEISRIVYNG